MRESEGKAENVVPGGRPEERRLVVEPGREGVRLDRFLADSLPAFSRAGVQRLIRGGRVLLNGRAVRSHHKVRGGDLVVVSVPPPAETEVLPEAVPLEILYEDADLLVVNKPAGIVVHPAGRIVSGTLVNALLAYCTELSGIGGSLKPGIVHRLDKGTSGCIAVAKNDRTHHSLSAQFARREVSKEYLAIVRGNPERDSGRVEALIGRHPLDRKRMAVLKGRGRRAVTRFEVLERFPGCAYVKVVLETGRTHQIRVQMAHLGFPVVGDPVYGKGKGRELGGLAVHRPMLHAWRLGFRHPGTGAHLQAEAPLPKDFKEALKVLRSGMGPRGDTR